MKKDPTFSQITYMVTGLMSSFVQKNGTIDEGTVRSCVDLAKVAYDYISELYPTEEANTLKGKEEKTDENPFIDCDIFKDQWVSKDGVVGGKPDIRVSSMVYGCAEYDDIVKWLKEKKNITNNRKIDNIIDKYLLKDNLYNHLYHYLGPVRP